MGDDRHTERVGKLGRALADPSQADDAHRLAGQFDERRLPDRKVGLVRPLAGSHGLVVQADVVAQLENQGEDVLRDRVGAVHRHVRDRDATPPGRRDVDAVKTRRRHRDEPQCGRLVDHGRLDRCLVRDQYSRPSGTRTNLVTELASCSSTSPN